MITKIPSVIIRFILDIHTFLTKNGVIALSRNGNKEGILFVRQGVKDRAPFVRRGGYSKRRHDIQQNDTQHNDTQR